MVHRASSTTPTASANVDLNLHAGPPSVGLQAQIAYQDTSGADVKYAYRNTDWFTETVATDGQAGRLRRHCISTTNDNPIAVYFDREKKALYLSVARAGRHVVEEAPSTSSGPISVALNQRTGEAALAGSIGRSRMCSRRI